MTIQELHNAAIEKTDLAIVKKFQKEFEVSNELFREAFELEKQAALLSKDEQIGEPTESVLLKSAACLALDCKEYREAEKLISIALSGEPPYEIAEELRNLLEDVNLHKLLKRQRKLVNINLDNENSINVELTGILTLANNENHKIQLTTNDRKKFNIKVTNGLSEIVKKYFGESVKIKGKSINNHIELVDIYPV